MKKENYLLNVFKLLDRRFSDSEEYQRIKQAFFDGLESEENTLNFLKEVGFYTEEEESLQLLKESLEYFLKAKSTLKDKISYYSFFFEKSVEVYLKNKNKTGFLHLFFECKLYPVFKPFLEENGLFFGCYNKGKNLFIQSENEDIKESLLNLPTFEKWYSLKQQKESVERQEKKESLLKKDFKILNINLLKTVEEVDFYLLKLQQMKKDFKKKEEEKTE